MTETDDEKHQAEIDALVELIALLTEELGTELELHYTEDELPKLGNTETVLLLVRAARTLRKYKEEIPSVVGKLLLAITITQGNA